MSYEQPAHVWAMTDAGVEAHKRRMAAEATAQAQAQQTPLKLTRTPLDADYAPEIRADPRRNEPGFGIVKFRLADGKDMEIETRSIGPEDKDAQVIFWHHGMPGSRVGPYPSRGELCEFGLRLIGFSRPGYGGSTRQEGRIVADCATVVEAMAAAYGVETASVAGRSGGGPHALGSAALLANLVVNAATMSSSATVEEDFNWLEGGSAGNAEVYGAIQAGGEALWNKLEPDATLSQRYPRVVIDSIIPDASYHDATILRQNNAFTRELDASHRDGMRNGPAGRVDDVLALRSRAGFRLSDIKVPVWVSHGGNDAFSPKSHYDLLVRRIPNARPDFLGDVGHIGTSAFMFRCLLKLASEAQEIRGEKSKYPGWRRIASQYHKWNMDIGLI